MSQVDIDKLRKAAVKEIVPQLPTLSDEQLAELRAAEENESNPRESLLHAIRTAQSERGQNDSGDGKAEAAQGSAAEAVAWKQPDYAGPLTIEQANWRRRRIKPVVDVATK